MHVGARTRVMPRFQIGGWCHKAASHHLGGPLRGNVYLAMRLNAGKRNGGSCDQRTRRRVNLLGFRFSFYVFLFTEFLSDDTTRGAQRIDVWGAAMVLPRS